MSKCRLLQELSTGVFRMTIPNGTIKLQSHLASQVNTRRTQRTQAGDCSFVESTRFFEIGRTNRVLYYGCVRLNNDWSG